ncbi:MAG: trigger factor [Eubacteriales bacterium]|nr:trigger factor [Eubacteriales bacterium]
MKTTFISKEGNDAKFTMVFTGEEFENAIVDAYKSNKDRFEIKGFRKGKAPRKIIENTYGEDIFYDEALNNLLQMGYPNAVAELDLEVVDQPKLNLGELKKGEDVEITATVTCFPEVEAKDYFGLEVEKIEHEVSDEDVEKELERVQKAHSSMETVTDRKTENGDTVMLDFDGSVDGEHFDGGKAENFELKLGSGQFIPGFEEQLVGKDAGEAVDVHVTFPEDYHAEDLAGKEALFECKINEIKKENLPEINDEFASDVSEFETLDEYKKSIREKIQKQDDETADRIMRDSMVQKLTEVNDVDVPAAMVESEIDNMLQEMQQQLSMQGLSLDQYMKFTGMDASALREQARMDAQKRVELRILLKAIVKQENIEATEEDIEKELTAFAEQYGQPVEDVKKMLGDNVRYFEEDVKSKKAIDMMFEKANFVEPKAKEEE